MSRQTDVDRPTRPHDKFQKSYPTILHFAVLSSLVLPFAFIPYVAARRQVNGLRKTADLLEKNIKRLRADIDATMTRQSMTSTQLARLQNFMGSRSNTFNYWRDHRRLAANGVLQDDLTELKRALKDLR